LRKIIDTDTDKGKSRVTLLHKPEFIPVKEKGEIMKKRSLISLAAGLIMWWSVGEANALYFTIPYDANLYLSSLGGEAAAVTEFGIGNSIDNYTPFFTNLPNNPTPNVEIFAGSFLAGTTIDFYQRTQWGATYWAFSNNNDLASQLAFYDLDNSLNLSGSSLEQTTANTWVLHLDDAASYNVDDDDNDLLLQMRLSAATTDPSLPPEQVPEPSIIFLMGSGLVCLVGACRKKKE
jgi:hypothetical protein